MILKEEFFYPSKDEKHDLHTLLWQPAKISPKAVLQISHGMTEHIKRYDEFATYLAERGFIVVGQDHLGHGQSVHGPEEWGYFSKKAGSQVVVEDVYGLTCLMKKKYSDIPYYVLGHSMGSFIMRRYIMTYGKEIDGAIIMGTGKKSLPMLGLAKMITVLIKALKGEYYRSHFLSYLMFSAYNKRFGKEKSGKQWLTKDEDIVKDYINQPACNFIFTINGMETLLDTLVFIEKPKHIHRIPRELPIHIIAGVEDPVGDYGKGPKAVYNAYKKLGVKDITLKLYEGDRHEVLNEIDRQQVYSDLEACLTGWLRK